MPAHGIKYPVLFSQFGSAGPVVSPPGFLWKLTLSSLNPGQYLLIGHLLVTKLVYSCACSVWWLVHYTKVVLHWHLRSPPRGVVFAMLISLRLPLGNLISFFPIPLVIFDDISSFLSFLYCPDAIFSPEKHSYTIGILSSADCCISSPCKIVWKCLRILQIAQVDSIY